MSSYAFISSGFFALPDNCPHVIFLSLAARLAELGHQRIKLVKMDAHKLLFLDDTFDVVVGTFVFCSVDNPGKVAREIRRVLSAGERFVTLGYHSEKVNRLLRRAGLTIVSVREWSIGCIVAEKTLLSAAASTR